MIKQLIRLSLLVLLVMLMAGADQGSIQAQIDAAEPGTTITLANKSYAENLVIDKPVHIKGDPDTLLINKSTEPTITIASTGVTLEQLAITHETKNTPALLITGSGHAVKNITIQTKGAGIKLDEADDNNLSQIHIIGDPNNREHGIDLWESDNNQIIGSTMTHVKDGIYAESSQGTQILKNTTSHSRYGFHLMFTRDTLLKENTVSDNVNGMMIMGTKGTVAEHNTIKDNQQNVQSLGLLLFDVEDASIQDNTIMNNRIGIFIDEARNNVVAFNDIRQNYIGLQMKQAENNQLHHNAFSANVVQGQAEGSANNDTSENYWGDHRGLTFTKSETSDLPYEVQPFFLHVTSAFPPLQLLFDSPGMGFLETLIHTPEAERLIDHAPLLENPLPIAAPTSESSWMKIVVSLMALLASSFIIIMGVKQS